MIELEYISRSGIILRFHLTHYYIELSNLGLFLCIIRRNSYSSHSFRFVSLSTVPETKAILASKRCVLGCERDRLVRDTTQPSGVEGLSLPEQTTQHTRASLPRTTHLLSPLKAYLVISTMSTTTMRFGPEVCDLRISCVRRRISSLAHAVDEEATWKISRRSYSGRTSGKWNRCSSTSWGVVVLFFGDARGTNFSRQA